MSKPPLCKAAAVRAASALASGYDSPEALGPVHQLAEGKAKDLHGIAAAALWDGGACVEAREHAAALGRSRNIAAAVWGGLVLRATPASALISEASFRGLEQGWVH
jgi:hypothetical protein